MEERVLRMRYLEDARGGAVPSLDLTTGSGPRALELSDRARWLLTAISLPREMLPADASDERARLRLGSRVWSSGEIMARIPYQHRSTIRLALGDLRERLDEVGLVLEDELLVDTRRGRYGLRPERVTVDIVDLHDARDDPAEVDRLLDAEPTDRRRVRLAERCVGLLDDRVRGELEQVLSDSIARAPAEAPGPAPAPAADPPPAAPGARGVRWRLHPVAGGVGLVAVAAVVTALVLALGSSGHARAIHPKGPPRIEHLGSLAHTWSNPQIAGGRHGLSLRAGQAVSITCRTRGFRVQDGNVWWYLVGSAPWSDHFYVTADAFYNNGHTRGTLIGSKFVDRRVPTC